jgi:hypothetical protein
MSIRDSISAALPLEVDRRNWRRAPLAPFALAAAALLLEMTTHLVDFGGYDLRIRILDSASEWSWSHIAATVAFAAGTVAGVIGARRAVGSGAWWASAAVFGVLFLDNVTRLHAHIGFWPAIYAPVLLGLAASVWLLAAGTEEARVVGCGLALLFVSLVIHVFGLDVVRALGWSTASWAYQVKVALKEGLELAGWVLLVPALWRLARRPAAPRATPIPA